MELLGVGEGSLAAHTTKNPLQLRRGFANEQIYLLLSFKQQMRLVGISTIVRKLLTGCRASQGLFPPPLLIRVISSSIVVSKYKVRKIESQQIIPIFLIRLIVLS